MKSESLKKAISEAYTKDYEMLIPDYGEEHEFSDEFEKKMNKLIKKHRKPYYKLISTAGRRAACFVAIFIITFSTVMSVDALRNGFKDFFVNIFSEHSEIKSTGSSDSVTPDTIEERYAINYDLTDFTVDVESLDEISYVVTYIASDNESSLDESTQVINFQQWVKSEFDMRINTEDVETSSVDINGVEAIYFIDNHDYRHLIWDNGDYVFVLDTSIGKDALIEIAKSVQKVE